MRIGVIIAAGGNSARMNSKDKLMMEIGNVPVIIRTVRAFFYMKEISDIIVVCNEKSKNEVETMMKKHFNEKVSVIAGGLTRRASVYNGIRKLDVKTDIVLIHDGARPLIRQEDIRKCINATMTHQACTLGVKSKDTIKTVNDSNIIESTLDRDRLYNIQTPQGFTYEIACQMHQNAEKEKLDVFDDCMLAERKGYDVYVVEGSYDNIKITTEEDVSYVEFLLLDRQDT